MRVLRMVLGILSLLSAMPILAAGAIGWWTMQHRSPDGAFRAQLAPITTASRIVIVPDVDALLRRHAPFARADQTELRLAAGSGTFLGMALPADLAGYLAGVNYTEISGIGLGRGPLALQTRTISSAGQPPAPPSAQPFWVRRGLGELRWTPTTDRDRQVALVVIAPPGDTPVHLSVALTASWLDSTTWGLFILGPMLLLFGLITLAWPERPREIVYILRSAIAARAGRALAAAPALAIAPPPALSPPAPADLALPPPAADLAAVWAPPAAASGLVSVPPAADLAPALAPAAGSGLVSVPPAADLAAVWAPPAAASGPVSVPPAADPALPPSSAGAPGSAFALGAAILPGQLAPLPSVLSWPPEEPPGTQPAEEILSQEFPVAGPERPMPTAGMQLHLSKPK